MDKDKNEIFISILKAEGYKDADPKDIQMIIKTLNKVLKAEEGLVQQPNTANIWKATSQLMESFQK